jgi:HAD superfamily hydrolase (TIGR01509 family)
MELVAAERMRPGLDAYLERARALDLTLAIVSSSSAGWITSNLTRLGRAEGWAGIHCANGDTSRAKPLPCLYEEALEALGVDAGAAVAFEDSPHGVHAAKAAGLFCVAVPNPVTRELDLGRADLVLGSFEDASLDEVLAAAARR